MVQYCMKHPKSHDWDGYFKALLDYNVGCFYYHIKPNQHLMDWHANWLKYEISGIIKQDAKLKNLDIQKEIAQTTQLLQKANTAYHKKLSVFAKTKIFLLKPFVYIFLR